MSHADEVRARGLQVGDTIEGRELWSQTEWQDTRLTLLWVGNTEAVWLESSRTSERPEWTQPEESTGWSLEFRKWKKVTP